MYLESHKSIQKGVGHHGKIYQGQTAQQEEQETHE
jgi:hypothetical protein